MYASDMPRKPKPTPDDPEQFKRFAELAREVGADSVDTEKFDRVLKKIARMAKPKAKRKRA